MWTQKGHAAAQLALAFALGSGTVWAMTPLSGQVPARVRVRGDTLRDTTELRLIVNTAAIDRMIRELVASKELERTIAMSLRDAAAGQRSVSPRVRVLSDSLSVIARRNAELMSKIEIQCPGSQPHPDGYLGVWFEAVQVTQRDDEPAMYKLGFVQSVSPGSPAERAGIKSGDQLLSIGGADASQPIALSTILKPGAKVQVKLQRGSSTRDVTVQVEKRPEDFDAECVKLELLTSPDRDSPVFFRSLLPSRLGTRSGTVELPTAAARSSGFSYVTPAMANSVIAGATVMALDDDWRQTLGVDNGLLVMKVAPGTPAKDAGLRASDVIVSADGESVASMAALRRVMNNANDARSSALKLQVIRAQKTLTLTLRWQERP